MHVHDIRLGTGFNSLTLPETGDVFTVNKNPTRRDIGKFGWAMLAGFGVVGGVLWLVPGATIRDHALLTWSGAGVQIAALCLWALGLGLAFLSFTAPGVARPVYVTWMSVAFAIGAVVSTVLLTVLFLVLLPLFSLVVRAGDPLRKKLNAKGSYWEDYKPHEATLERMRRPF